MSETYASTNCPLVRRVVGTSRLWVWLLGVAVSVGPAFGAVEQVELWRLGQPDRSAPEFTVAPDGHEGFLQPFGSPDRTYYVGLSKEASDWP